MLPGLLLSVYQQYKQDTDFVASWLASTAKVCCCPADHLSSTKAKSAHLKGKARKAAKWDTAVNTPSKHVVAIADFLPLANYIPSLESPSYMSRKPSPLPSIVSLMSVPTSASACWNMALILSPTRMTSMRFFFGVLEAVRDVLRPQMTARADEVAATATATTTSAVNDDKGLKDTNRFTPLAVYEPSQAFLDAPPVEPPKPDTENGDVFKAEPQTSNEDVGFAFILLMGDLIEIRAKISVIWSHHRDGIFDLAASAVATNTAVEFGHGLIDELRPLFITFEGSTWGLVNRFYLRQCRVDEVNIYDAANDGIKDILNYHDDTYKIANECGLIAYRLLNPWPDLVDPHLIPLYMDGRLGVYDPHSNWDTKNGSEKFQEDQILISEFFAELLTIVRLIPKYPVVDGFMRAMKEIDKTPGRELPFYAVFAAQVFLDIHHTMRGAIYSTLNCLTSQMDLMDKVLAEHLEFHKKFKIDNWPGNSRIENLQVIRWIRDDPVFRAKARVYSQDPTADLAPDSKNRILLYSPVISGLILFRLRAGMHDIGIHAANAFSSISYSAHLYNALVKENLLTRRWADMDVALTLLGDSNIWVGEGGNSRPSTPRDYYKINFHSRAGPRRIKEGVSAVSSVFANRYCNPGSGTVDWTPEHVDGILAHSAYDIKHSPDDSTVTREHTDDPVALREKRAKAKAKAKAASRAPAGSDCHPRVAPTKLLQALVLSLDAEAVEMAFPYLMLHCCSWLLLRAVRDACDPLTRELYGPAYLDQENQLAQVVGLICRTASGAETGGVVQDLRLLQMPAGAVDAFLGPELDNGTMAVKDVRKMGFKIGSEGESDAEGSRDEEDSDVEGSIGKENSDVEGSCDEDQSNVEGNTVDELSDAEGSSDEEDDKYVVD